MLAGSLLESRAVKRGDQELFLLPGECRFCSFFFYKLELSFSNIQLFFSQDPPSPQPQKTPLGPRHGVCGIQSIKWYCQFWPQPKMKEPAFLIELRGWRYCLLEISHGQKLHGNRDRTVSPAPNRAWFTVGEGKYLKMNK